MFKIFQLFGTLFYLKKSENKTEGIIPNIYIKKGDANAIYSFKYKRIIEKCKFNDSEIKLYELILEENKDIIYSFFSLCLNQFYEEQKNLPKKIGDHHAEGKIIEIRNFNEEEVRAVKNAWVVPSQNGNSVCFELEGGCITYIPLLRACKKLVGDTINLKTARLITLEQIDKHKIYSVDDDS